MGAAVPVPTGGDVFRDLANMAKPRRRCTRSWVDAAFPDVQLEVLVQPDHFTGRH
jgi:hypothetical protein